MEFIYLLGARMEQVLGYRFNNVFGRRLTSQKVIYLKVIIIFTILRRVELSKNKTTPSKKRRFLCEPNLKKLLNYYSTVQ